MTLVRLSKLSLPIFSLEVFGVIKYILLLSLLESELSFKKNKLTCARKTF